MFPSTNFVRVNIFKISKNFRFLSYLVIVDILSLIVMKYFKLLLKYFFKIWKSEADEVLQRIHTDFYEFHSPLFT